jgi:hypothetical protein
VFPRLAPASRDRRGYLFAQQFRQLGDIRRNAPRLIAREQIASFFGLAMPKSKSGSLATFTAFRRASLHAAPALKAKQQLRQLRHVDRNPPRLVFRE